MKINIYKRVRKSTLGKKRVSWYYSFIDSATGKKVQKTCGSNGHVCKTKKEAQDFVQALIEEEKKDKTGNIPLKEIAKDMFEPQSEYIKYKTAHGVKFVYSTIKVNSTAMRLYILPKFGNTELKDITTYDLDNYLLELNISSGYKNKIVFLMKEIFLEARRRSLIVNIPAFQKFHNEPQKKDILTKEELKKLFPDDIDELTKTWKAVNHDTYIGIDHQVHCYGLMWGIMFYLIATTGMRQGEARALSVEQIKENGILIDRMIDNQNVIRFHLKKGTSDDPRARVVLVPSKVMALLKYWITIMPPCDKNCIFSLNNRTIRSIYLEQRFNRGLANVGIIKTALLPSPQGKVKTYYIKDRHLSPHSLRFTYNSLLVKAQKIPQQALRQMIGHKSIEMTDYYTRHNFDNELEGLQQFQDSIEDLW